MTIDFTSLVMDLRHDGTDERQYMREARSDLGDKLQNAADAIEYLQAEVARLSTPPDAIALVAAAYRDAAEQPAGIAEALKPIAEMRAVDKDKCEAVIALYESMAEATRARTPADAEAHLTALLRAEYERGVRAMADMAIGALAVPQIGTVSEIVRDVQRALLTQEGR